MATQMKGQRSRGWNDYEKIYEEDGYFEEMGEGARGFRVYNDETELMDAEMVNGWAGTLDTLFLFVRIT